MKLTEQDKERLIAAVETIVEAAIQRFFAGVAPSEPLPGPNPGGVSAEELGDGWELCSTAELGNSPIPGGWEWWNPAKKEWRPSGRNQARNDPFYSWRRPKKQEQPTNEDWSKHPAVQAAVTEALRQETQPIPPDPGPRHRLVDTKTEKPRDDAEVWE